MYNKIQILCLIAAFSTITLQAQEISLSNSLDRDSALIGEQLGFSIGIHSSSPLHSFIPLDDNLFSAEVEVIAESIDSTVTDTSRVYNVNYLITSFDSGYHNINSIPVLINNFVRLDTLYTKSGQMIFYMPEVDTSAAIKDIKEPIKTPFKIAELLPYAPYAGGVLILAAVILLFYFVFLKNKKKPDIVSPSVPPHEKALISLYRIKKEKLWQKGDVKEYYSQLSDTIRSYIEESFNIRAMESVTWEILEDFKEYSWDDEFLMELLESLLQLSDLVKYAKEDPSPSENETNLNNAFIFVEKTKVDITKKQEKEEIV